MTTSNLLGKRYNRKHKCKLCGQTYTLLDMDYIKEQIRHKRLSVGFIFYDRDFEKESLRNKIRNQTLKDFVEKCREQSCLKDELLRFRWIEQIAKEMEKKE